MRKNHEGRKQIVRNRFLLVTIVFVAVLLMGGVPSSSTFAIHSAKSAQDVEVLQESSDDSKPEAVYGRPLGSLEVKDSKIVSPTKTINYSDVGLPEISELINRSFIEGETDSIVDSAGRTIHLSIDKDLQRQAKQILKQNRVPWGAVVAIEPQSGRILAMTSHSGVNPKAEKEMLYKASYPAASLFKLVTAAAAVERKGMVSNDIVHFRGGNYTLNTYNYSPDAKRDRRALSIGEAMGKSVNAVFARVALQNLSGPVLEQYALNFGFNMHIPFDAQLDTSRFNMESSDYAIARTAAGFGRVTISPIHAALLAATLANDGKMMRPYLLEEIERADGSIEYQAEPQLMRVSVLKSTATELLKMMRYTVRTGTAKNYFQRGGSTLVNTNTVAAKTGTLSGEDPKGVYRWFIATAPLNNPKIAIATLVVDPGNARIRSGAVGKKILDYYFKS